MGWRDRKPEETYSDEEGPAEGGVATLVSRKQLDSAQIQNQWLERDTDGG